MKIFYKYEGVSPAGSHKPNTAIPQAYYNKQEGITKISTETGAGQWGSALSIAGALFGIDVEVFMVKVSYDQKPYRRFLMETYGAKVHASPIEPHRRRAATCSRWIPTPPDRSASRSPRPCEVAFKNADVHYSLGSVLNHVCLHQTIIGLEAIKQMEMAERGARRRHRLRRRRLQLRGHRVPVLPAQAAGQDQGAPRGRRAQGLPDAHRRRVPLRPRRRGRHGAAS